MSFLTKYTEFGLLDENLLAWHEFNSATDSGPNSGDLTDLSSSPISWGSPVWFNESFVEPSVTVQSSFSAFFSIKKTSTSEISILLSNFGEPCFYFGFSPNSDFFIYAVDGDEVFLRFYKNIKPAAHSIFVLSRDGYNFSLSLYSPLSGKMKSESISVPDSFNLGNGAFKLGMDPVWEPQLEGATSNFLFYEFALINVSIPNFCKAALCEEFFQSSGQTKDDHSFSFLSMKDKEAEYILYTYEGSPFDIGTVLPYSQPSQGFALVGKTLNENPIFFRNGEEDAATIFNNYVTFASQSSSDQIVLDNFDDTQTLVGSVSFSGSMSGKFPYMKPILSSASKRELYDFATLDSGNLCFGKNIIFPETSNLIKI